MLKLYKKTLLRITLSEFSPCLQDNYISDVAHLEMHLKVSAVLEITSVKCFLIKSFIITHFHKACVCLKGTSVIKESMLMEVFPYFGFLKRI